MKKIYFIIMILLFGVVAVYGEEMKIKITFNNETVIVKLFDNDASYHFYSQLPMTLKFQDYINTEKIGHLPEKLPTRGISEKSRGDFTYYAPWGNLAIFYNGYGGGSVVHLGIIESGKEKLAARQDDFTATIDKLN